MWTTLATAVALIAVKILQAYWQRTDQTDAARWRVYQEMQAAHDRAGIWKMLAWSDPRRASALGLLPDAQGLRLLDPDHPATGSAPLGGVPPGGPP